MDRRELYEQSKDPYRFSIKKIMFYSVRESILILLLLMGVFGALLYVFQRDRWQTSILIPLLFMIPIFLFGIVRPLICSLHFLKEQESLSGQHFEQRTDMDRPIKERDWLLCFMAPGFLIFNRHAIQKVIGFTASRVSMTHDGTYRIHMEYLDAQGYKHSVDFKHSQKNKKRFEAWYN